MAWKKAKWFSWRGICAAAALSLIVLLIALQGSATQAGPSASSPLGPLPPDWSLSITDVLAIYSPATATGSVTVVAPPVVTAKGDIRSAVIEEAPALIEDLFGEPRPAGNPVPLPASDAAAPGLLVPLTVELEDGFQARIEATGYPVPGGKLQLFLLAAPSSMPDDDTALQTARTLVDHWRAAGLAINERLTPELTRRGPTQTEDVGPASVSGDPSNPDDKIENVIQYLRFPFDGSNPASAGEPVTVTALLLRDGRVFESEARAPTVFDPSSRPPGSAGTGRWRRDGEAYALAFTDGTQGTAVSAAAKTLPAPASLLLSGTFTATGGEPAELLPATIEFYPDGSLLLKDRGAALSGAYEITGRTARVTVPGREPGTFLFGLRGELATPVLIVLGNRIYERQTASP
ncbi:MAG: hypothetical protein MUC37_13805 [Hyphomicrobium sp.]|nr:hypothetical protein [Hyphomicrobium sp.]